MKYFKYDVGKLPVWKCVHDPKNSCMTSKRSLNRNFLPSYRQNFTNKKYVGQRFSVWQSADIHVEILWGEEGRVTRFMTKKTYFVNARYIKIYSSHVYNGLIFLNHSKKLYQKFFTFCSHDSLIWSTPHLFVKIWKDIGVFWSTHLSLFESLVNIRECFVSEKCKVF